MTSIYIGDALIPTDSEERPVLWRLQGMPGYWFPTKIVAETFARHQWPDMPINEREARVRFAIFTKEQA